MDKPASRREILGEHLQQKVKEVYGVTDDKLHELISKMTGILLEMPDESIVKMLTDASFLKNNIKIVEESMRRKSSQRNKEVQVDTTDKALYSQTMEASDPNDVDRIADQAYEKIYRLDPALAPQITGMILELNREFLLDMMKNESLFLRTYDKARSCLVGSKTSSNKCDSQVKREELLDIVFKHAEKSYKDHAPKITGMILELDQTRLEKIVSDSNALDAVINKAYSYLINEAS